MVNIYFYGENFSPKKLKELTGDGIDKINLPSKTKMTILAEVGEIGTTGRYKGEPMPYGLAWILVPDATIDDTITILSEMKPILRESGIQKIDIDGMVGTDKLIFLNQGLI